MTGPNAADRNDQELAAATQEMAAYAGLGRHRQTYLPRPPRIGRTVLLLVLSIGGVIATVICLALQQPVLAILCGLFPVIPIPALIRSFRYLLGYRGARLDLYEAGLVAALLGRLWVARYDSTTLYQKIVHHMRNGHHIGTTYSYTLSDLAGTNFVVADGISDPELWGPAIQRAVAEAQLPQALSALRAGHRIAFGELWMTWYEVGSSRKSAPWAKVEQVSVSDGRLSADVAGRRLALTAAMVRDIPNFVIFEALAEHMRRIHGAPQR